MTTASPAAGPDRTYLAVAGAACEAIVVHCSDSRLQLAFREFISTGLGLLPGDFMPLVVSGGAGALAHPDRLPKEFKFMRERLEFYRAVTPSLKRVVLINHEGCRYYQALKRRVLGQRANCESAARDDLDMLRPLLEHTLSHLGLELELYYARFTDPTSSLVVFERAP